VQTVRVRLPEPGTPGAAPADAEDDERAMLTATGYVMAAHKIELASKSVGRVAWVGVEAGDRVEKGQVIARLEDDEYKARVTVQQGQLDAARAKLAELEAGSRPQEVDMAEAMVDKARAELTNAEVNFKRLSEAPPGAVSRQQVDDAQALVTARRAQLASQEKQFDLTKAGPRKEQVDAQRAAVRQLEGSLALAMIDLDNTIIRSPLSGTVLQRNVELGEFITTGFVGEGGAKGFVVSMADLKDLRVELDVSQNDVAKVKLDQPCRIVTDAYPDKSYRGVVHLISPEANRQKATVQVRVRVLEPDELLKPDMNATVHFLAPRRAEAASQPGGGGAAALAAAGRPAIRVPATAVRDGAVFVVEDGRAVRREVQVARAVANGQEVEVRAGLIGARTSSSAPRPPLQDGARVRVGDGGGSRG
jgi:HlyD family secretion protein